MTLDDIRAQVDALLSEVSDEGILDLISEVDIDEVREAISKIEEARGDE